MTRRKRPDLKETRKLWCALIARLGGRCVHVHPLTGRKCSKSYLPILSIDHVEGRTWHPADFAWGKRIRRYWEEFEGGVKLRVLCRKHNSGHNPGRREGCPGRRSAR